MRPVLAREKSKVKVGYVQVLQQNSNFRNLWYGQLISSAGDWFNNVALLGLVLQLTGNGFAAGLVLIANSLPLFLLTPLAGPIVDRFDRRKVMLVANFFGAVFALSFLFIRDNNTVWIAYVGTALLVSTAAFFNPAAGAITPTIVRKEELFAASALSSSAWGIMVMIGSGLGGLVSALLGRDLVFGLNALSFLLSNLLIWQVKLPIKLSISEKVTTGPKAKSSTWADFVTGLNYIKRHPAAIALLGVKSGWAWAGGVIALFAVFGGQIFKLGDAGIGLLFAARGGGALLGPFLVRPLGQGKISLMRWTICASFLLSGLGYLLFGFSEGLGVWLALISLLIGHSGGGNNWITSTILLQEFVPNRLLGRVLSFDVGLTTLSTAISTLIFSAALQNGISPVTLAYVGAAIFTTYGLLWMSLTVLPAFRINQQSMQDMKEEPALPIKVETKAKRSLVE